MTTTTQVRSSRRALAALSLPVLMASLDTSIANTALPTIAHALSVPFAAVQWIVLTYLLALTPLLVVAGRLGDRFGRRRVLEAGVAGFTAASLACGLAPSLAVLLVARTVQGMGAAAMLTMGLAFAGDVATAGRAGRVMGLLGTMSALGTAAGPALGALLATHFGWHALFLVNVPVGLVILVLVRRSLAADPERTPDRASALDLPGTLLLATALVAYALAMTPQGSRTTPGTLAFAGLAVAGALAFVRLQGRATTPLVALELFRDRVFAFGLVSSALVSAVIMSALVVGPFHLARARRGRHERRRPALDRRSWSRRSAPRRDGWPKFGTRATALAGWC
ncbi:MAG: MFS transporter [Candidatus Eisenbacteria bacterium]